MWKLIIQPNGCFAVYSADFDKFVTYDLTEDEARDYCRSMGWQDLDSRINRARSSPHRMQKALRLIEQSHGDEERRIWQRLLLSGTTNS